MKQIDIGEEDLGAEDYDKVASFLETAEGAAILELATCYAVFVLTPPRLAERLRRSGDRRASARDFECPCYTDAATGAPICFDLKPACRIAASKIAPGAPEIAELPRRSPRMKMTIACSLRIVIAYLAAPREDQAAMKALLRRTQARALGKLHADFAARHALPAPPS